MAVAGCHISNDRLPTIIDVYMFDADKLPTAMAEAAMAAVWVQAICTARAPSISSRGAVASTMASAAFKAVSETPLNGSRAATCSSISDALTKALELVPSAFQALVSPSGGYDLITPALGRPNLTRTGGRRGAPTAGIVALVVFLISMLTRSV